MEVKNATYQCMREVIMKCFDTSFTQQSLTAVRSGVNRTVDTPLEKILSILQSGLTASYSDSWYILFDVYSTLFPKLGKEGFPLVSELIRSLGDLHSNEHHTEQFTTSLERAIGSAITSMGPENVLRVIPLKIVESLDPEESKSWMIPLLHQSIQRTELQYFTTFIIPLAKKAWDRSEKVKQSVREYERNSELLYQDIYNVKLMEDRLAVLRHAYHQATSPSHQHDIRQEFEDLRTRLTTSMKSRTVLA